MRRVLTTLALFACGAFAQDRGAAPANYAREAFDTAQEILKTRPYDFRALYATLLAVTSIQPAPTPADLDAAQEAAIRLIANPGVVFASTNKPADMTDQQWAQARIQTAPFVDQVLIALDKLRGGGTQPAIAPLGREPITQSPSLLKIDAQYSDEARLAGLEGSVEVTGMITADGAPQNLRVSQPLGLGLDEQAIAAVAQLRFTSGSPLPRPISIPIDFALPSKQSRWHLVGAEFKAPEGAARPTFAKADYPFGSGLSLAAYDEARVLGAIGRAATVTVSFDIDERGDPGHFQVVDASADVWGPEAVMVVQSWRFHPGMKVGMPVSVPCTLKLIWGPEDFTSNAISTQVAQMHSVPQMPAQARTTPQVIFKTEPVYTDEARQAGLEGTVEVLLTVDEQGAPQSVRGALGMGLEESAKDAISRWRFQPTLLNGQPVTVSAVVQVNFRLLGVESSVFNPPVAAAKPQR